MEEYAVIPYTHPEQPQSPKAVKQSVKINPQELGQVIVHLQDEIKTIKTRLENLPGYDIGKKF
jgi:hypothetical protein